jgi:hypothetical protein
LREQLWREERARERPEAPDDDRAEDRAAIVAGAADDQHRPHLKGQCRDVVLRCDKADEMALHRTRQPEDRAAEHEGLQAVCKGVLAEFDRRSLVLADAAQHSSPRTADESLKGDVDRGDDQCG